MWEAASQIALRAWLCRAKGGGRIYSFQQNPGGQSIESLLLIRENQICQVNEFSAFLCVGRGKSLGSLNSFL